MTLLLHGSIAFLKERVYPLHTDGGPDRKSKMAVHHIRPANFHGFTVRLTVWGINSQSHDLAFKSHGESENLEIAKQFR